MLELYRYHGPMLSYVLRCFDEELNKTREKLPTIVKIIGFPVLESVQLCVDVTQTAVYLANIVSPIAIRAIQISAQSLSKDTEPKACLNQFTILDSLEEHDAGLVDMIFFELPFSDRLTVIKSCKKFRKRYKDQILSNLANREILLYVKKSFYSSKEINSSYRNAMIGVIMMEVAFSANFHMLVRLGPLFPALDVTLIALGYLRCLLSVTDSDRWKREFLTYCVEYPLTLSADPVLSQYLVGTTGRVPLIPCHSLTTDEHHDHLDALKDSWKSPELADSTDVTLDVDSFLAIQNRIAALKKQGDPLAKKVFCFKELVSLNSEKEK